MYHTHTLAYVSTEASLESLLEVVKSYAKGIVASVMSSQSLISFKN
jgi:hypothetical protein